MAGLNSVRSILALGAALLIFLKCHESIACEVVKTYWAAQTSRPHQVGTSES
jgi:hypothetical protein